MGLPSQEAEQIFSAFFTTKPEGSGMGLPSVNKKAGALRTGPFRTLTLTSSPLPLPTSRSSSLPLPPPLASRSQETPPPPPAVHCLSLRGNA